MKPSSNEDNHQNTNSDDSYFVGSSTDVYNIWYQDDHTTYGMQYENEEE